MAWLKNHEIKGGGQEMAALVFFKLTSQRYRSYIIGHFQFSLPVHRKPCEYFQFHSKTSYYVNFTPNLRGCTHRQLNIVGLGQA